MFLPHFLPHPSRSGRRTRVHRAIPPALLPPCRAAFGTAQSFAPYSSPEPPLTQALEARITNAEALLSQRPPTISHSWVGSWFYPWLR